MWKTLRSITHTDPGITSSFLPQCTEVCTCDDTMSPADIWHIDVLCSVVLIAKKTNEKQVYSYSAINITLCVLSKPKGFHLQLFCRDFTNECVPLRKLKGDPNKWET